MRTVVWVGSHVDLTKACLTEHMPKSLPATGEPFLIHRHLIYFAQPHADSLACLADGLPFLFP